ncbi:MAG TPA: polyphenol oxidase family protein [Spirochaetia bacterium]|nr:polyphenol oxidase family protein [Spirochaetia bacterium]
MAGTFSLSYTPDDDFCPIPLLTSGAASRGVRAGLSLAKAGDMALSRRTELPWRDRFLSGLGAETSSVFALHQVHSRNVLVIGCQAPRSLVGVEGDGMVSDRPDALLTVTVADCLPVFLADKGRGAYGIVHSGWKGTGIVREALRLMTKAFGTAPAEVLAVLGPCIGTCCYRVQHARYEKFRLDFGDHAVARGPGPDDYRLDLRAANVELLAQAGVSDIRVASDCTCCSPALGSFRRQGPESFTRMLAFIGHLSPTSRACA